MPCLKFRSEEHLKSRREIGIVFKRGRSVNCPGAKLFVLKQDLGRNRIAFTFARKFGNAVERNRSKRLSREAYRHLQHTVSQGYDMVLLVYPEKNSKKESFALRMNELRLLFSKAHLLRMSGSQAEWVGISI
jgi:ribonuclease P protein component